MIKEFGTFRPNDLITFVTNPIATLSPIGWDKHLTLELHCTKYDDNSIFHRSNLLTGMHLGGGHKTLGKSTGQ